MSQHEMLEKFISLVADEVSKRMPKPEEVTAEQFQSNIGALLVEADWFKSMVKEFTEAHVAVNGPDVEREAEEATKAWLRNNFDISEYTTEIERIVESAVEDIDFNDKVESAVDDIDIDRKVQDEVEEQVASVVEAVERIEKRVVAMERYIKAVQELPPLEETK